MKTPFPGMDPYLEHPALWPFRNGLIAAIVAQLQPLLVPRYVAAIEQRVYLKGSDYQRVPDAQVQQAQDRGTTGAGAVAVATPEVVEVKEEVVQEWTAHVLDRYRDLKVVAVLEVVSPSNKAAGPDREPYLDKQREVRSSESHLIEIDVRRRGRHVVSVPEATAHKLEPCDYLACVSRWPQRKRYELYRGQLRERLPCIGLPLVAPDRDVPLDVQAALEQAYWGGRCMLRVRYDAPCEPGPTADEQAWASERWASYKAAHSDLFPTGDGA